MGVEIEKKFLLKDDFPKPSGGQTIRQGYLNRAKERTVRVRTKDEEAFLTIKGLKVGDIAPEFEYPIPLAHANHMLDNLCEKPIIEKTRHAIEHAGITWEVDVFRGDNEGLAFAEVELTKPDQRLDLPPWIGKDVTDDPRYFNTRLSETPFKEWNEAYTVILYFAPAARELGERLAGQLNEVGFRVRAGDWSEAKEPEDGPLTFYAPVNAVHFHPTAEAKAVQIRDGWAHGFALKEGDVTGHGSTWVVGPRLIYLLVVASEAEP